jgi:hypothetical protein
MIRKILFFLLIFLLTLVWRFPYERAIADRVSRLEASTGIRIDYQPRSASIFGVEWSDVHVTAPSGMNLDFRQAKLRPGFTGLSAYLQQKENQHARLTLNRDRLAQLRMDRLEVQTNSPKLGLVRATGDLSHDMRSRRGEGNLRLELPDFQAPLPVADLNIEIGSKVFWQDRGQGYELRCDLTMMSGDKFHAEGNLAVEPQPGQMGRPSGNLRFRTPMARGKLLITGGTWKDPQWTLQRENS